MRLGRFFLILFSCLLWLALPTLAQFDLDELYEAPDEVFEFLHPEDWEIDDDDYDETGIVTLTGEVGRDAIFMNFVNPEFVSLIAPRARGVEDVEEALAAIFELSDSDSFEFEDGREAIVANFENDTNTGILFIVEFENGDLGLILVFASPEDALEDEDIALTVLDIVASFNSSGANDIETSSNTGSSLGNALGGTQNQGGNNDVDGLPSELDDFDGDWRDAVAELEDAGILGSGGSLILAENLVFGDATSAGFVPIGSRTTRRDVLVGGEIDFAAPSNGAICGISARNNNSGSLLLALTGAGEILVLDTTTEDFYSQDLNLDMDESHHLLFLAQSDELSVYVDGELIFERVTIGEDSGSFTLFMDPDGERARCDIRNFWAYEAPVFVAGLCEVFAAGTVNKRSGPGTNFDRAGTMNAGDTMEVIAQAEGSDGFTWYQLEDDSWVREDIISLRGDCGDIPEED